MARIRPATRLRTGPASVSGAGTVGITGTGVLQAQSASADGSGSSQGGGSSLVHGESFSVPGSGYGTRTVDRDIWDNCSHGDSVATRWNNATENVSYETVASAGRGIALPHSGITRYAYLVLSAGTFSNAWLSTALNYSTPNKLYCIHLRRYDDTWTFGPECNTGGADNNTKYAGLSTGTGILGGTYWYHDQTGQKCALANSWGNSFYSSGGLGNLNTTFSGTQGGSGDSDNDPWYGWVQMEYRVGLGSSGQILRYLTNNTYYQNLTGQNTDDETGTKNWAIGNYSRRRSSTENLFLADIAVVIGADAFKRVMLTNNATYADSTIVEFQPIVEWNGTITATCNQGRLSAGTVHCHVFDEDDNGTYAGELEIAA